MNLKQVRVNALVSGDVDPAELKVASPYGGSDILFAGIGVKGFIKESMIWDSTAVTCRSGNSNANS